MMKRIVFILTLTFVSSFTLSCSDDDNSTNNDGNQNFLENPEALAVNDNSNFVIYKGVFIGSTGYVVININNEGTLSATLSIDGETLVFSTDDTIEENEQTSINFISGNNSFTFTVSSDGTEIEITNINIEGHPDANILLVKEYSFALVKLYEGTYDNNVIDENGIINGMIRGDQMDVLAYSYFYDEFWTGQLGVINNVVTGDEISGTINGNTIGGTWFDSGDGQDGNWTMNRTY